MSSSAAATTGGLQEEAGLGVPILWRLNRLDHILKHLEDIKCPAESPRSTCSSYASTTNSTATTNFSGGDISPPDKQQLSQSCRPIDQVLLEVQQKGTLIQRLIHVEARIFKLGLKMEEELESETRSKELLQGKDEDHHRKGGLKKLIKSCVKKGGGRKNSNRNYKIET